MMYFNDDILKELKEFSPLLATMPRFNPFKVPEGYFNTLVPSILDSIELETEHLSAGKVSSPFEVPNDYFNTLAANVMMEIKSGSLTVKEEINSLSPLLASLQGLDTYQVPAGFFDDLVPNQAPVHSTSARVIKLRKPVFLRYAAAAVISGIMGLSFFSVFNHSSQKSLGYSAVVMNEASSIVKSNSFDQEFKSLSSDDIEYYLEQSGQDVEAALVASVTEEPNALPAADAYLKDDNTLDEFLNKMNLNN